MMFKNVRRILALMRTHEKGVLLSLLVTISLSSIRTLLIVLMPRYIIQELLGEGNLRKLLLYVAILTVGTLGATLILNAVGKRVTRIGELSFSRIFQTLSEKTQTLVLADIETKSFLSLTERARYSLYQIFSFNETVQNLGAALITALIAAVILAAHTPWLILLLLALNLANLPFLAKKRVLEDDNAKRGVPEQREYRFFVELANDHRYAKDLKLYGAAKLMLTRAKKNMDKILQVNHEYYTKAGFLDGLMAAVVEIQSVIIFLVLGIGLLNGSLTPDVFVLLYGAAREFGRSVQTALNEISNVQTSEILFEPVVGILDMESTDKNDEGTPLSPETAAALAKAKSGQIHLDFQDVRFRYPTGSESVLNGCSFTIEPGQRVALVGLNGAGKTTLVKLLCRFYEDFEGDILLNGVSIRAFPKQDYYDVLAPVFQDLYLLPTRIDEVVSSAYLPTEVETVTMDAFKALDTVQMTEWVKTQPQGIRSYLTDALAKGGVLPSGGQAQKLALARALYHKGPFLIMDEPTAALDPRSEEEIFSQMLRVSENSSALFISHRLSSTRYADKVVVLADGVVREEGTHESLLEANQGYAKLFRTQAEWYA